MKAGRLRHRITFQRDDGNPDGIGGNAPNWVDFLTVWASVEPLSSRELVQGAMIRPDTTHTVRIRYRTGLHAAMRFTWQGRIFNLTGPPLNTEEIGRELVMLAKEAEAAT
jgi:SPP1 family predicted phage head-tail adaptor